MQVLTILRLIYKQQRVPLNILWAVVSFKREIIFGILESVNFVFLIPDVLLMRGSRPPDIALCKDVYTVYRNMWN